MRIVAHPLVVAAALGLIGPAALAEDEPPTGLVGEWERESGVEIPPHPEALGNRIEVIPVEEDFVLGGPEPVEQGSWTRLSDGYALQIVVQGDTEVRRSFSADGDTLVVRTEVRPGSVDSSTHSFVESFSRQA
jgi:hypothetical protein